MDDYYYYHLSAKYLLPTTTIICSELGFGWVDVRKSSSGMDRRIVLFLRRMGCVVPAI